MCLYCNVKSGSCIHTTQDDVLTGSPQTQHYPVHSYSQSHSYYPSYHTHHPSQSQVPTSKTAKPRDKHTPLAAMSAFPLSRDDTVMVRCDLLRSNMI